LEMINEMDAEDFPRELMAGELEKDLSYDGTVGESETVRDIYKEAGRFSRFHQSRMTRSTSLHDLNYGRDQEELDEFQKASEIAKPGGFRRAFLKKKAKQQGISEQAMPATWSENLIHLEDKGHTPWQEWGRHNVSNALRWRYVFFPTLCLRLLCLLHNIMPQLAIDFCTWIQTPILLWLRPGQWLWGWLGLSRARTRMEFSVANWGSKWQGLHPTVHKIAETLNRVVSKDAMLFAFQVHSQHGVTVKSTRATIAIFYVNPYLGWLDTIEIDLRQDGNKVVGDAKSCSCSIVPPWIPFAPLLALWLCWIPFIDFGCNLAHLQTLRAAIEVEHSYSVKMATLCAGMNQDAISNDWPTAQRPCMTPEHRRKSANDLARLEHLKEKSQGRWPILSWLRFW